MEIRPLEFSIVIVASDCNPTILNPDWLMTQGIVSQDWGWKVVGSPITTPPFATVNYDSGISITVETNKFHVAHKLTDRSLDDSPIAEIAVKYIEALPHVRYTGVGHNFKGFAQNDDAETYLKERFLKAGIWDSKEHPLEATSLKFSYPMPDGRFNLSLDGAAIGVLKDGEPKELLGVLVQANFHRECKDYPSYDKVIAHLANTQVDWKYFQDTVPKMLG